MQKTMIEKYGCTNPFQSKLIMSDIKKKNMELYGVEYNGQREDVKEKIKQTFLTKYGTLCPMTSPDIQERIRKACYDKYGVEYHAARPDIIKKRNNTCMLKYGVMSSLSSSIVREKINKTILDKYGVENIAMHPDIKAKILATMIKKYGVENALQHQELLQKLKDTNILRYGSTCVFNNKQIRDKCRQTVLQKYGCEHVMQNPDIAEKASNISRKFKDYTLPSGNIVRIQGYEDKVLKILLENYKEEQILTRRIDMPEIWYLDNGKYRRYYPDLYIPSDNTIVEVKSIYTYMRNIVEFHRKRKACEYLGYTFKSYICKTRNDEFVDMYI
jgi:hypothetical protein